MGQLLRLTFFLFFIGFGQRIPRLAGGPRRRAINLLLVYTLVAHAVVVLTQRDFWPFSTHAMMANDAIRQPEVQSMIAWRSVTADGREWSLDPLAWSPLYPQSMRGWFELVYPSLPQASRRVAAQFLFEKSEKSRSLRVAGKRFGNDRLLGVFAAPDTYAYRRVREVPAAPFTGIRIYRLYWRPRDLLRGSAEIRRQLLIEYRQP